MSYYRDTYLKSGHWQDLRLEKMAKAKAKCCICLKQSTSNDVHHITYGKSLFEVKTEDLRVVCRKCHEDIHEAIELNPSLSLLSPRQRWAEAQRIVIYDRRSDSKFPIPEQLKPFLAWCFGTARPKIALDFALKIRAMINYQHAKLEENAQKLRAEKIARLMNDGVRHQGELHWLSNKLGVHPSTLKRHSSYPPKTSKGAPALSLQTEACS